MTQQVPVPVTLSPLSRRKMSPSDSRTPSPKTHHTSQDFSFAMRGLKSGVKNFSGDVERNKYEPP